MMLLAQWLLTFPDTADKAVLELKIIKISIIDSCILPAFYMAQIQEGKHRAKQAPNLSTIAAKIAYRNIISPGENIPCLVQAMRF